VSPSSDGDANSLALRFEERWIAHRWSRPGDRLLVACSGGVDSLTLLHLLRFSTPRIEGEIEAAYFDHRLRDEAADEALWLRGVAAGWRVPMHLGRAAVIPGNEEEAREARYRYLDELRTDGFRWLLTAHHEDDQVETILFRILRGTGVEGLRGIPEVRDPGILRPLLPFSRQEIEGYANAHSLRPRKDSTNQSLHPARNRIRLGLLPALEKVHPGAREGLLRLARHAESAAQAVELLLLPLRDALLLESGSSHLVLDRDAFLALEDPIGREFVRRLAVSLGVPLSESGTAAALEFMRRGSSGKFMIVDGELLIRRDFGKLTIAKEGSSGEAGQGGWGVESPPVLIPGPAEGAGELLLLGRRFEVHWGVRPPGDGWEWLDLPGEGLHLPLIARGWKPGDRMRTQGGEKKLKKLFLELRIPVRERARTPLLVDSTGEVLWIAGWKCSREIRHQTTQPPHWGVGIRPVDEG